jgi:hypothetical protein
MRLRVLVGRFRLGQLAGEVDIEVALAGTVDAVGPVQAGVEPLRGVRRDALGGQHVASSSRRRARRLRSQSSRPSSPSRSRCRRAGRRPGGRIGFGAVALVLGQLASASSSATERHSHDGTEFSSTFFRRAGTPALRKYFCARMSAATWLNCTGTSMSARRNTIEPSGFLISLVGLAEPAFDCRPLFCVGTHS